MFGAEALDCGAMVIDFQTSWAGSMGVRPSRKAREYVPGRLGSGLKRVTSVCQSVPWSEPWR